MGVKWEDAVCCKTEKSGFAEENERASEGSEKWISTSRKGCWGHVSLFLPMQKHDIRVSEKCHNMGDRCGSLNLWDLDWSSYKLIFYVWCKWEKPLRSFTNQEPEASERTFCPLPKYAACACVGVGVLNLNHPVYPAAASITLTLSIKHYMKFYQKKKKNVCCPLSPCSRESNTLTSPRKSGEPALLSKSADNTDRVEESSGENTMRWTGFTKHSLYYQIFNFICNLCIYYQLVEF